MAIEIAVGTATAQGAKTKVGGTWYVELDATQRNAVIEDARGLRMRLRSAKEKNECEFGAREKTGQ